jgi:ech hydrogenase subunit E
VSYTLALGPQHIGLGGPQRLVLQVADDTIADVEYRLDVDAGTQSSRLTRFPLDRQLYEVGRFCERSGFAHALAYAQALETLLALEVPQRAAFLRVAAAELERLSTHLGNLHGLFAAMGLLNVVNKLTSLRDEVGASVLLLVGKGSLAEWCLPGGLARDLADDTRSELSVALKRLNRKLFQLAEQIIDQRALLGRTVDVSTLSSAVATQFALAGPLARASGLKGDLRLDAPYAAYASLAPTLISQQGGDVYARLVTWLLESIESCKLVEQALAELPAGSAIGAFPESLIAGSATSAVESPHGPLQYALESDGRRISEVLITPNRQVDRLLVRTLLSNAQLDNVVLIMRSVDVCPECMAC